MAGLLLSLFSLSASSPSVTVTTEREIERERSEGKRGNRIHIAMACLSPFPACLPPSSFSFLLLLPTFSPLPSLLSHPAWSLGNHNARCHLRREEAQPTGFAVIRCLSPVACPVECRRSEVRSFGKIFIHARRAAAMLFVFRVVVERYYHHSFLFPTAATPFSKCKKLPFSFLPWFIIFFFCC